MLTQAHIDELVQLRASARLAAEDFSEAIKAAAEKHDVNKSALRKYISAKEKDQLAKIESDGEVLASLLESPSQDSE